MIPKLWIQHLTKLIWVASSLVIVYLQSNFPIFIHGFVSIGREGGGGVFGLKILYPDFWYGIYYFCFS